MQLDIEQQWYFQSDVQQKDNKRKGDWGQLSMERDSFEQVA